MQKPIAITGLGSLSASGCPRARPHRFSSSADKSKPVRSESIRADLKNHFLTFDQNLDTWVGRLPENCRSLIEAIRSENKNYKHLDPSVLYVIYTSRLAVAQAGWEKGSGFGINIGSSRGATELFEKYYSAFAKGKPLSAFTSPSTTLGNISSWVAQDLQSNGPEISHSITCSTALHALLNGIAWLRSGMCDRFLVGGSEAALTPFTIAQMRALSVLTSAKAVVSPNPLETLFENTDASPKNFLSYPCRALDLDKSENTMVLGEGSASVCLELGEKKNALAYITGLGYATETLRHAVSISAEADCFQKSMKMALESHEINCGKKTSACAEVNTIVMHAPGTIAGDMTEYGAIQKVFGQNIPLLTSNKWQIGHTFGASGLLSLELAVRMLQTQQFIGTPFLSPKGKKRPLEHIMVNAVGFGGNAVSVILSRSLRS